MQEVVAVDEAKVEVNVMTTSQVNVTRCGSSHSLLLLLRSTRQRAIVYFSMYAHHIPRLVLPQCTLMQRHASGKTFLLLHVRALS
jgi:hypothetical protein